jgi:hypothetical protein
MDVPETTQVAAHQRYFDKAKTIGRILRPGEPEPFRPV